MNKELKILQNKYSINLFSWSTFLSKKTKLEKDANVLILGDCDENLIFPIAEKVNEVYVIVEHTPYQSAFSYLTMPENVFINEFVLDDKESLYLALKVFEDLKFDIYFDYVLIPSLTNNISTDDDLNKVINQFRNINSLFKNDNKNIKADVLVAFDNNQSLDKISGEKIDSDLNSFNYNDILNLKKKNEDFLVSVYYPMPEYRFPIRIYSENYLPTLDDEDQKTRNLVMMNKFNEYANSYLLIIKNIEKEEEKKSKVVKDNDKIIYIKFNVNRVKQFALRTSIIERNKNKIVVKKALYKEANEHIVRIANRIDLIKKNNKNIVMLDPICYFDAEKDKYFVTDNSKLEKEVKNIKPTNDGLSFIEFPFINGQMLSNVVIDEIKEVLKTTEKDKRSKVRSIIEYYMELLIGKKDGLINIYNLDSTFSNAIKSGESIYIIDGEWIDDNTTEVNYLKYRILKYFYKSYSQNLNYNSFKELIRDFEVSTEDAERYEEAENKFQKVVHGNINGLDIDRYENSKTDVSKFYYVKSEYERIKDQLERIVGEQDAQDYHDKEQNEILRLTNVHVANLDNIITSLRSENEELAKAVQFYHKRESIIFKVLRVFKKIFIKLLPEESIKRKICKYIYRTIRHPFKMFKTFFTKAGRNRIVGDFMIGDAYFECGKVALPKCEDVKVSIIIPCYNQIRYTYKCLNSIMKNTDPEVTPYEVIIADDVSTDTTKNIKKYVDNVVVSRNETNLGFLKNCNNAAKLAKGEYLYFLNNDTEVKENYLSALVSLLDRDSAIGMAGSKLIFADGKLQEAGGIIWSDGTGANFGRGQNPKDFPYNYVREVDYISGAAIMIRKNLWDVIGGFDERYAPAYCEDSDLAFEVRKHGMKVVYEPLSEVIHYEGVSNGTDVNDKNSMKSYQVENMVKLKEKWDYELTNHYPATATPNFYKARERNFDKKVILFIDHYIPTWDKDAGSKTTFAYIKMFLNRGYIVKFLGDNFSLNSPYGEVLQQMGVEVLFGNELQANIWDYLIQNKRNIDFVYLNRPHIAIKYIDFVKQHMYSKVIFYGHDLHYLRLKREYEITYDDTKLYDSKYYRSLEYSLMYKSDITYYPSEIEINEIHLVDENINAKAISAYIFPPVDLERRDFSDTVDLLFVGGFAHAPNVDAIKWFDNAIMPRIRARNMNIRLNIVGSNATDEIKAIGEKEGYNFIGFVSDEELEELYKKCRIVIAPLRYGAGIKGKIVEAMSKGCAIVTTACGAEGIKNAEKFMVIKDSAQDFAYEIIKLYDDLDELSKLSYYARKEINNSFSEDAAFSIIEEDFK